MYYKLQNLAFYFVVPVMKWLLVIFLILNFLIPLMNAWAVDMLSHFFQMLADELRGFVITFLPEWLQ